MAELDKDKVVSVLNQILESELAGVVCYTHYSFLVFGFGRIPIISWLRAQADESLTHAHQADKWITTLGAYPSLEIGLCSTITRSISRRFCANCCKQKMSRSVCTANCSSWSKTVPLHSKNMRGKLSTSKKCMRAKSNITRAPHRAQLSRM